jgi:restriction endonuclease Mrr
MKIRHRQEFSFSSQNPIFSVFSLTLWAMTVAARVVANADVSAIKKAREAHHSIILIDGIKLVELMHQYNVGVQVKTTYEVKELDNDFFEED